MRYQLLMALAFSLATVPTADAQIPTLTPTDPAGCFASDPTSSCDEGDCFINVALSQCSDSCFINVGVGYCHGDCFVNAGASVCWDECYIVVHDVCVSELVQGQPDNQGTQEPGAEPTPSNETCFFSDPTSPCGESGDCFINAALSACAGDCFINVGVSTCTDDCFVNVAIAFCSDPCFILVHDVCASDLISQSEASSSSPPCFVVTLDACPGVLYDGEVGREWVGALCINEEVWNFYIATSWYKVGYTDANGDFRQLFRTQVPTPLPENSRQPCPPDSTGP